VDQVSWDVRDFEDSQVLLEALVTQAPLDLLGSRVRWVLRDLLASQASLVLKVLRDLLVSRELQGTLAHKDHRDALDLRVLLEELVLRVSLGHRELLASLEQLDSRVWSSVCCTFTYRFPIIIIIILLLIVF